MTFDIVTENQYTDRWLFWANTVPSLETNDYLALYAYGQGPIY